MLAKFHHKNAMWVKSLTSVLCLTSLLASNISSIFNALGHLHVRFLMLQALNPCPIWPRKADSEMQGKVKHVYQPNGLMNVTGFKLHYYGCAKRKK